MSDIVLPAPTEIKVKKRVLWVDLYRVMAILCSIAVHVHTWEIFLSKYFGGQGRILFFFFISGFFMNRIDWKSTYKRLLAIGIPYLTWCAITAIYFYPWSLWTEWEGVARIFGLKVEFSVFHNSPLWFLRALLVFTLLNPIVSRLNRWLSIILCVGLIMLAFVPLYYPDVLSDLCFNYPVRAHILGFALYVFGSICRRFIGISDFLGWCEKHAWHIMMTILIGVVCGKLLIWSDISIGKLVFFLSSIFTLPAVTILLSQYFPLIVQRVIQWAPAMFFVYVSQIVPVHYVVRGCNFLAKHDYVLLSDIIRAFSPFVIMIFACFIYTFLARKKFFSGWLLIKM